MKKLSFGLFGLSLIIGNHFGSMLGIAVAICVFMIIDGLIEEIRNRPKTNIFRKGGDK